VHGNCQLQEGVYAVVECATYRKRRNNELTSHFFEPLVKEMRSTAAGSQRRRKFYLVDTEAIADPCFVIPDVGSEDAKTYFRVNCRDDWVHVFEDWLNEAYPEEYKNDLSGLAFD
jgi:putative lipase involved disintegration of autophagic bodies